MKRLSLILLFFSPLLITAQSFDKQKLDDYLKLLETSNKGSFSIAISKNSEVVYESFNGYLSGKAENRIDKNTKFRIGSITKTFTSTIIFQLIEEGKLSIEDKLSKFFPKVLNADQITIELLLGHRSGIHNYTADSSFGEYITSGKDLSGMIEVIESMGSDFEPGAQTSYSNSGYLLLGAIIEEVTGKPYPENLNIRIIDKLDLKNTAYGGKINNNKNEANSLVLNGTWNDFPNSWHMSTAYAAGAVISTPRDLNKFMHALFNYKMVSEKSVNKMKEVIDGLGHGLFVVPFYEHKAYGHNGRIDSFDSGSYYFGEDDVYVTFISNGLTIAYNDILVGILSIYFGKSFDLPVFNDTPLALDPSLFPNYEGVFSADAIPLKITIKGQDKQLTGQATGQGTFPLTSYSNREFRYDPAGIVILFGDKSDGVDYSTFVLKQGGQQFNFKKD